MDSPEFTIEIPVEDYDKRIYKKPWIAIIKNPNEEYWQFEFGQFKESVEDNGLAGHLVLSYDANDFIISGQKNAVDGVDKKSSVYYIGLEDGGLSEPINSVHDAKEMYNDPNRDALPQADEEDDDDELQF